MKNPFKKQGIVATLVNVGIGGAANVAMDYVINATGILDGVENADTIKNAAKIAVGAIGGTMLKNQYAHAALDGIAVVGVSNLVDGLVNGADDSKTSGLPEGTIGRIRLGQRGFARRARSVRGVGGADFMEC